MQEFGWIKGTTVKSINPHHKVYMINKLFLEMKTKHPDLKPEKADNKQLHIFSVTDNVKKYHFYVAGIENVNTSSEKYTTTQSGFDYLNKQPKCADTYLVLMNKNKSDGYYAIIQLNNDIDNICKEFKKENPFDKYCLSGFNFSYSPSSTRHTVVFITPPDNAQCSPEESENNVLGKLIECIKEVVKN